MASKDRLFQSSLDRNAVERALKDRPQPEGCSLHVDEADQLVAERKRHWNRRRARSDRPW